MKKEDLMVSFDNIKPTESARKRMLDNILSYSNRKKGISMKLINYKKAVPALALVVVAVAGLLLYNMLKGNFKPGLRPGNIAAEDADIGREDYAAPILNQFRINGRHYIILSDELRSEYGLPDSVNESDIGSKIADITVSPDKSLIGSEVYRYVPAGGEAVVAVKKDNEYRLFRFFTFESYNNNQDEDAIEYLKLYGIDKADDIAKILFIRHSEQSKLQGVTDVAGEITDRDEIAVFFGYYSALKNTSDKYFERLFNFNGAGSGNKGVEIDTAAPDKQGPRDGGEGSMTAPDYTGHAEDLPLDITPDKADIAEDMPLVVPDSIVSDAISNSGDTPVSSSTSAASGPSGGMMDMGDAGAGTVEGVPGSVGDALADPVTIRIYNNSGIYYDTVYYINIGFISRYEISKEFADFISGYLDK
ncbi:MAG: hypothetical protein GX211_07700 [Clostridiaceae bacterium]|jgi:hypothetical protein|nr:hypothetical protein [Clostridiaceae bacterium]